MAQGGDYKGTVGSQDVVKTLRLTISESFSTLLQKMSRHNLKREHSKPVIDDALMASSPAMHHGGDHPTTKKVTFQKENGPGTAQSPNAVPTSFDERPELLKMSFLSLSIGNMLTKLPPDTEMTIPTGPTTREKVPLFVMMWAVITVESDFLITETFRDELRIQNPLTEQQIRRTMTSAEESLKSCNRLRLSPHLKSEPGPALAFENYLTYSSGREWLPHSHDYDHEKMRAHIIAVARWWMDMRVAENNSQPH